MKKKKLGIFAAMIILLLILSFAMLAACNNGTCDNGTITPPTPLSTPLNLTIETYSLSWDAVSNASYYEIEIDGAIHQSAANSFTLLVLATEGDHNIRVRAISESANFLDSNWSNSITFSLELFVTNDQNTITGLTDLGRHFSKVVIPASVTSIGNNAFNGVATLTSVVFEAGSQLTTIGWASFSRTSLTSIIIPASVILIDSSAFSIVPLTSVAFEYGSQLTTIAGNAFTNISIASITIPASVTTIGNNAFANNALLTSVVFEDGNQLISIGSGAFFGSSFTSITIPASVTTIGGDPVGGNTSLTSISVEDGNTHFRVENNLLIRNSDQTVLFGVVVNGAVTIPASVLSIGNGAFNAVTTLTSVIFETGSQLTTIGSNAFRRTSLTSIILPSSVTLIGFSAFRYTALTSIVIPASLTTLNADAFAFTSLTSISIEDGNTHFRVENNLLIRNSDQTVLLGAVVNGLVTIPASVTSIVSDAFLGVTTLLTSISVEGGNTHFRVENNLLIRNSDQTVLLGAVVNGVVTIPASVVSIANGAFSGVTTLLTSISVEGGNTHFRVENNLLIRNSNQTVLLGAVVNGIVTIPASVISIGAGAFNGVTTLTSIIFEPGSQLTSIGGNAFRNTGLTSITIPYSVTTISSGAFLGWTSTQTIYVEGRTSTPATFLFWWSDNARVVWLG